MKTLLAVDGGNSKTDVVVLSSDGTVLARGRGGPFVPQSAGVHAAADVAEAAVRQALGPGAAPPYADRMAAYLAGADLPAEEEALAAEFAARGFARDIVVGNDTFALLRAGASEPWGVAVVCGAGINAVGVSPTGRVARFPAIGPLVGDWGGGVGLTNEVMWHAARAEDGRGEPTALTDLVKAHFGTDTVEQVAFDVYFGRMAPLRLLELTAGLFEVAKSGDEVATMLVTRMADEIAGMVRVCLTRLDLLETPTEVVLGGGVLRARHPMLMDLLDARLVKHTPHAKPLVTDAPPIVGAALNGLDAMGASEEAKQRLRAQF